MSINNNKTYLDRFPAAAGIVLLCTVTGILVADQFPIRGNEGLLATFIFQFTIKAGIFIALGFMLNEMKAAAFALGVSFASGLIYYLFTMDWESMTSVMHNLFYFTNILLSTLPYFLFVRMSTDRWKRNKILLTVLVLLVIHFTLDNHTSVVAMYSFFEAFSEEGTRMSLLRGIAAFINSSLVLLAIAELMNYVKDETFLRKKRLLNLENNPSATGTVTAFCILKTALFLYLFFLAAYIRNLPSYLYSPYLADMRVYLLTFSLGSIISMILLLFALAWYLRKLMFEHVITYNLSNRSWIWFFLLPGVGFIALLASLATGNRQTDVKAKINTLEQYSSGGIATPLVISGIGYLFLFIRASDAPDISPQIAVVVAALLYFLYARYRAGFYILAGLQALGGVFAFIALLNDTDTADFASSAKGAGAFIAFIFLGLLYTLLQLPVFHPTMFEYIPAADETEETEEGKDLFADYRLN